VIEVLAQTSTTSPGLVAAFGAGILSFLSPCVLPLVPGYLSLMSGVSGLSDSTNAQVDRWRVLRAASLFVMGFSLVFVAYGAVASALGSSLLEHKRVLSQVAGVLIVLMGLVVMGVLSSRVLTRTFNSERRFHVSPSRLGPYAAPVMGMAFAFGWTPCIGPVLAAVLTLAAGRDTLDQGVWLLVAYSAGLGVPFIASGLALDKLTGTWAWFRRHGRAIDLASGGLLVAFGVLLATSQLGRLSTWVIDLWTALGWDSMTVG
jgi:cytochrome c-type biogenesis protein